MPDHPRGQEFLVGGLYAFALYSSCMSSPWTLSNVGADEKHAASANRLIGISTVAAFLAGGFAGFLDRSWWAVIGAGAATAVMVWLYGDAMGQARAKGYQGLNTAAGA